MSVVIHKINNNFLLGAVVNKTINFPKNQHFIPRSVLRAFSTEKNKSKIFFIKKHGNEHAVCSNLNNVACINKFYNYESNGNSLEVDFFGKIDNETSNIIKQLLAINHISGLDTESFKIAAKFMASQICRVPDACEVLRSIESSLKEQISPDFPIFNDNVKDYFLDLIVNNTKAYTEILLKKKMTIYRSKNTKFIIGDNPVVILDGNDGSLKITELTCVIDAGVFFMPISPTDILVFFDDNSKKNVEKYIEHNNDWQFVKAHKYVFGADSIVLENELKNYHGNAYRYIAQIKPSLIEEHRLIEGEPISIGRLKLSFEGQAKQMLLSLSSKK